MRIEPKKRLGHMPSHNKIDKELQKDLEFQKKIEYDLQPFLDKIIKSPKTDIDLVKDTLEKSFVPNRKMHELMETIFHANAQIDENATITEQIHEMFTYLGLVESLVNYYVDILVMVKVAGGIDFHMESLKDTPRINHAMCIEDLQNNYVSLKTKLNFLSGSGLKLFVSTTDNARKLRNDIAHFKIRLENGKILLRNKPVHEIISINQRKIVNCINRTNWVLFLLAVELDIASAVELLPKDDKRKLRKNV
jgi:hypothetical protein